MLDQVFAPGTIGGLRLPHRIVMGSMHLGIEHTDDGGAALAAFYAARARGGAGLIVTGGSAISRVGAGGRHYGFVNEPAEHGKLAHVAQQVHAAGGLIALQLFHAGRYAFAESFGLQPVAPSAVPSRFSPDLPLELTADAVRATIDDFAVAGRTAVELGFDAVEVMGSEGYLINQFVSPLTNLRDDEWGGDAQRRMAFPLAVLAAVRAAVGPRTPVILRMSGDDLMPGSSTPDEIVELASSAATAGADALNIGIGWHESRVPTVQAMVPGGTWEPQARRIRQAVDIPVISGNRINRLDDAEQLLRSGATDFVSMARPFLADPELMTAGAAGRPGNICIGCNQACIDRSLVDLPVSCMVNPAAGHESEPVAAADPPGRFAVVGGGPAGLAAALTLGGGGHRVTIFEAADALGGQFRLAALVPDKADYADTVRYYADQLERLGVEVVLGHCISNDDTGLLRGFDAVVLATGVVPRRVELPGSDLGHVLSYPQAFAGVDRIGGTVAVVGSGGIAVDLAHLLSRGSATGTTPARFRAAHGLPADAAVASAQNPDPFGTTTSEMSPIGRQVVLMGRSARIGARLGRSTRWALLDELRRSGVRMITAVSYRRITADGILIDTADGPELVRAETVVIAAGQLPQASLAPVLTEIGVPFRVVGGARSTDEVDAVRAFAEGRTAALDLISVTPAQSSRARQPRPVSPAPSAPFPVIPVHDASTR